MDVKLDDESLAAWDNTGRFLVLKPVKNEQGEFKSLVLRTDWFLFQSLDEVLKFTAAVEQLSKGFFEKKE